MGQITANDCYIDVAAITKLVLYLLKYLLTTNRPAVISHCWLCAWFYLKVYMIKSLLEALIRKYQKEIARIDNLTRTDYLTEDVNNYYKGQYDAISDMIKDLKKLLNE